MRKPRAVWAVDLGGTKIAAARVTQSGEIGYYTEIATPSKGGAQVVEAIVQLLERRQFNQIEAMGIGVPGLTYPDGHVWAPNLRGWERMPLGPALSKRFRIPTLVESDRNCFVVGEAWRGAARNCRDVVFVVIGTGIGAGILVDGRLLRGHGDLAGAVGWMVLRDRYLPIYGKVGCFEAHSSGAGIQRAARQVFGRGRTAGELTAMARRGNMQAILLLQQAGHFLGLALANLVDVLNPEIIVIGGGVATAGELLLETARETMKRWGQPIAVRQVRVVRSRLGTRAGLLGAAKLAFDSCDLLRSKVP